MDGSDADPVYFDYQCCIICAFPQAGSYFREEEMIRNQLKELEYESAHYRELEQHQQEIRRIRHDIKNELSGIYGYLENGEMEKEKRRLRYFFSR